eukprot:TRINITY_DN18258_c0_g2_i1.p1 TRINITY_DN18258_c0_g2~~TRINITY_DN18258_c0_g2_i1.p1  ORF type:complete len:364 (+),score=37.01 TRINITY_DN18258_c0_g2_i1:192-1283(+)
MTLVERFAACNLTRVQAVRVAGWCEGMTSHLDPSGAKGLVEIIADGLKGEEGYPHVGPWLRAHVTGTGKRKPSIGQKGCADVIPSLTAKGYWDPADIGVPQGLISDIAATALADLSAVHHAQNDTEPFQPYRNPLDMCEPGSEADDLGAKATTEGHWNVSYIDLGKDATNAGRRYFGRTLEKIENGVQRRFGHTFMSCLSPRTVVRPHYGPTNKKLRVYLPIVTTGDCGLRVDNVSRLLSQGEVIVFDDSFLHSAWNNTDRSRFVLITDVWHPDLTDSEIHLLTLMHAAHESFIRTQKKTTRTASWTQRGPTLHRPLNCGQVGLEQGFSLHLSAPIRSQVQGWYCTRHRLWGAEAEDGSPPKP